MINLQLSIALKSLTNFKTEYLDSSLLGSAQARHFFAGLQNKAGTKEILESSSAYPLKNFCLKVVKDRTDAR